MHTTSSNREKRGKGTTILCRTECSRGACIRSRYVLETGENSDGRAIQRTCRRPNQELTLVRNTNPTRPSPDTFVGGARPAQCRKVPASRPTQAAAGKTLRRLSRTAPLTLGHLTPLLCQPTTNNTDRSQSKSDSGISQVKTTLRRVSQERRCDAADESISVRNKVTD